ncbi:MAG: hypothetical protein JXB07_00225 [Anaerolineae bacterium]|nr:hypothetical protein [Anaerolineae bacterium]
MSSYNIIYGCPDSHEHIYGVALPIFIHNFSYHLCSLDVYADGVADCWELVPLDKLHEKVADGWISAQPPEGAEISVHDLGNTHALHGQWMTQPGDIVQRSRDILDQLNPEKKNLLDLDKRRRDIAVRENLDENQIWQARLHTGIYRRTVNGEEIPGSEVPIFVPQDSEFLLTHCFVYRDWCAQIGYQGKLLPAEILKEMLEKKLLLTSIPEGASVAIPGLGCFQSFEAMWYIDPRERWREILDLIETLNGKTNRVELCYQAYLAYQADPTDTNREHLRTAYEEVPEHQRLYAERNMDSKDHTIKHILYGADDKDV